MARIELNLYDENDEKIKTLCRSGIRWAVLKKIVKLQSELDTMSTDEQLESIVDVAAQVFEGLATREEIENGANFDEVLICFKSITSAALRSKAANFQAGAATNK